MVNYLHLGGLVAVGFDPSEQYLLTISHSGRGVFSTQTWERIARDNALAYPVNGQGAGIGPIEGHQISVVELDSDHPRECTSPSGAFKLLCESTGIEIHRLRGGNTENHESDESDE